MAAVKFLPDQKVFAKVRGHPPWPAKIRAIIDETPNRQKYEVYFYGTHETAVCKYDELFDYVEYRDKYSKRLKRRQFAEALSEIESELNPSKRKEDSTSDIMNTTPSGSLPSADKDSDDEGNLVIDESPAHKIKGKIDTTKPLKRKLSSSGNEVPETSHPEITSRSGRKIKPKKFLDEPAESNTSTSFVKNMKSKGVKESNLEENMKHHKNGDAGTEVVNGDRVELHWDGKQNVQDLINKSEQIEVPKSVKKDLKKSLKKKAEEVKQQRQQPYDDNENLELLKIEVQLLDADCRIKTSLSLNNANCDECLRAMDEILELKLNALMLKKHPEVFDTVKKLRKYVGNVGQWKLTIEEREIFEEAAQKIRSKADTMYNKFKSLFTIPNGKTFLDVYTSEVNLFQQKTNSWSVNELYGLVKEDPTSKE